MDKPSNRYNTKNEKAVHFRCWHKEDQKKQQTKCYSRHRRYQGKMQTTNPTTECESRTRYVQTKVWWTLSRTKKERSGRETIIQCVYVQVCVCASAGNRMAHVGRFACDIAFLFPCLCFALKQTLCNCRVVHPHGTQMLSGPPPALARCGCIRNV